MKLILAIAFISLYQFAYSQTNKIIKVACIGASITEGATLEHPKEQAYPQLLQLKLGKDYAVTNYGVSGTTMLKNGNLSYWNTAQYKAALQSNPDVVFIDLGGNDSKLINRNHLDEFTNDCHDMVQSFKQLPSHPRIILLLPFPSFETDTTSIYDPAITARIIPQVRAVAFKDSVEVLDMHSLFIDHALLMPDHIHPNFEGSHIIATRLYDLLVLKTDNKFHLLQRLNKQPDTTSFFGYNQSNFQLNGRNCIVVEPKMAAAEHPWIWRARFWAHEPQTDIALLEHGFAVVYCDVAELFGNDEAIKAWNDFYTLLHNTDLNKKAVFEGMSRGGIYVLNWAAVNPDKVACVYIDNPVLDLKMWPAGLGKYPSSPNELKLFKEDFNLTTDEDIKNFHGSPMDKVEAIAKGKYPILILSADSDEAVNPAENALLFQQKMKALNAVVYVVNKPGFKHHPHSLPNPTLIVDFINRYAGQVHVQDNAK